MSDLSVYSNTVRCAVQEIQDTGAESPLIPFEDIFTLLDTIREETNE